MIASSMPVGCSCVDHGDMSLDRGPFTDLWRERGMRDDHDVVDVRAIQIGQVVEHRPAVHVDERLGPAGAEA